MSNSTIILILFILIISSAFFSAAETAYSGLSKIKLKNLANNGDQKALKTLNLTEKYTRLISTVLIGNNIVNIVSTTLFAVLFIRYLGEKNGPILSSIVSTLIVLIFAEVLPKTIAKEFPEQFAIFAKPYITFLMTLFLPFCVFFEFLQNLISRFFKYEKDDKFNSDELLTMVEEAQNDGELDKHEADLVSNAIEFNDLDVHDILTPRIDVVAVSSSISHDELSEVFRENNYSRIPVYENNIDNIIGFIQDKDFYYNSYRNTNFTISEIIKDVQYTSPHVKISSLLRQLQQSKSQMAVVVDEYGGTEGIITMEDILEELVGEIYDEHDEIEVLYHKDKDKYFIKGELELKDLYEKILEEDNQEEFDFVTVSGWVIYNLNKMPEINDKFVYKDFLITVISCDDKKVLEIKMEKRRSDNDCLL